MATPTVTENEPRRRSSAERPKQAFALRRIIRGGWRISRLWARYLRFGAGKGGPELVEFACGNYFFPAFQQPNELRALAGILAPRSPERAMEIGTNRGGTLIFLIGLASPHATIISVDLPAGRFGGGYSNRRAWAYRRFARGSQRLHLIRGDSHTNETLERVKAALAGQPLDYLYIDGDHTYGGAKQDFDLYAPLVRKGGIIAMHDIAEHPPHSGCEVFRFWNEIKPHYRHVEFINDPKQGWAGTGLLYVD